MRLWRRASDTGSETDRGRGSSALVEALVQTYDPDAAVALIHRDWSPSTPREIMALAIALGQYRDLLPFGDACIELLTASEARHGWRSAVLDTLTEIGSAGAEACLQEALRKRWRTHSWDDHCTRLLNLPCGLNAMIAELHASGDPRLASLLVSVGWSPQDPADRAALLVAQGNLQAAADCGPAASGPLIAALDHVEDRYAVLDALSSMGTREASQAVVAAVAQQWSRGVSRWTDFDMITRCGGSAIPALIRLAADQPGRAGMVAEMLQRILECSEAIADEDLQAVASMPDLRHQYMVEDDPRVYEQVLDCSALREHARKTLDARGA